MIKGKTGGVPCSVVGPCKKDRLIDHMHETDCRRFVYYFHSLTAKRNNNNGWYNHI